MLRSEIIARLLEKRGIAAADLEKFLHPSIDDLSKPEDLPGIIEAADVILNAAVAGKRIVVFGDYDCDGICATAIMIKTLNAIWKGTPGKFEDEVTSFIPHRVEEGYGMSDKSVSHMLEANPNVDLVITVDNGVNTVSHIAELKTRGISVVVTDHHLPGDELPIADVVVDPKVAAPDHLKNLCGAGVAFLLARRILTEARRREIYSGPNIGGPLLILAGLATVTDIMPLVGQNRILVSAALSHFYEWAPTGLKELYARASKSNGGKMYSKDFGYVLGPRINAAGRMASGLEALELLLSDDKDITRELAYMIDGHNNRRKEIESEMFEKAMTLVVEGASAQVIDLPDGHPGIAGIVAARVMEKLGGNTPVCVWAGGHGSARSPAYINIRDGFVACAEVLDTYGGHAQAGGFSIKPGMVDEFRRRLCEYCDKLEKVENLPNASEPDLWIESGDIDLELAELIREFEPFGEDNREPVFGLRGVMLRDIRQMGMSNHISMTVDNLRLVWWNHANEIDELLAMEHWPHDIKFALMISDYHERHVELRMISMD